jgi:hypothetical protein
METAQLPRLVSRAGLVLAITACSLVATASGVAAQSFTPPVFAPEGRPDLTVSISDTPDPVVSGRLVTYTTQVRNVPISVVPQPGGGAQYSGPSARLIQLKQSLPAGSTFLSVSSNSGFTCNPNTFNEVWCTNGSLGPGQVATISIQIAERNETNNQDLERTDVDRSTIL